MSLIGLLRKYTRPKRLFRLALFLFGMWGLYVTYGFNFSALKEKFSPDSLKQLAVQVGNVFGTKAGEQLQAVLGEKSDSAQPSSQGSSAQVEKIIDTVQDDLRSFPQREVKKIQHQICEYWLQE